MNPKLAIPFAVLLVVLILGALIIMYVIRAQPYDEKIAACYALLPQDRKAGISASMDKDGSVKVEMSGQVGQPNVPTKEQLDAFIECLRLKLGAEVKVTNSVIIPPAPLGEVADHWSADPGGPKLALSPDDLRLFLLKIGEAKGTKAKVLSNWCNANIDCVTCNPSEINDETVQVNVALKVEAKLCRTKMLSTSGKPWAIPPPGTAKPWQDVDQSGTRYYFECKKEC